MSLMKTLAKVAVGVAVAKGVSAVVNNKQGGSSNQRGGGKAFGGQYSNNQGSPMDAISDMLSGGRRSGGQSAGLGGLMEQLSGGASRGGQSGGGLNDMLAGLTGGGSGGQSGGGLGGLLGALGVAGAAGGAATAAKSQFGDMFNQAIANQGEPDDAPTAEQEAVAALMLRAMIQAAKADGKIDGNEEARIMNNLGDDVTQDEMDFVQAAVRAPMDVDGLARMTPNGLEQQVYLMSVMAIDLDNQDEAVYLDQLARALGLEQAAVNAIHEHLGVPSLYA